MKQLLKNAKIYDGTGAEPFTGDILLTDDKITEIAPSITTDADRVTDLRGLSVAPGFIDAHSHNDWFAIKEDSRSWFRPFIEQGITTFVTGNCGLSAVGFEDLNHLDDMGGGIFSFNDTKAQYGTVTAYMDAVDRHMPCNMAILASHCTARAAAGGTENRPLTPEEEQTMLDILEKALKEGATGVSLGLMYEPGLYAGTEELKKVAALCVKYDRPLTVHPRAESKVSLAYPQLLGRSHLLRALDELVEVARGTKLKLHYSHAIFVGRSTFGDQAEFLRIMEQLRSEGVDAMFDIYNECLGVSVITVILPAWYQSMSAEKKKKLVTRLKLGALIKVSSRLLGFGLPDIQIAYIGPGYEKYEGKTVHEIAQMEGMSDINAYLMLCEVSNFKGRVNMGPYSTPEIIRKFEHDPHCLYMTDAWVEEHGVQNPAIYDCFPKFLRDALRGTGDTLQATIRRMTGATADRFKLPDRGYLRPGCFADLTVFDEDELRDATPDQQKSFGIRGVFINGVQVLDGDRVNDEALRTSGRAVRV